MLSAQLAKKYARAIFELASEENKLGEYGDELKMVAETVAGHEALKAFIGNPQVKSEAKKEILSKLFQEDTTKRIFHFLMLLVDKRRESLIGEIAKEYKALSNEAQNVVEAKITVASALSEAQEKRLIEKLEKTMGKTVVVEKKIDRSILGGVVVRIGDKLIDGSVTRRVKALKTQLLSN